MGKEVIVELKNDLRLAQPCERSVLLLLHVHLFYYDFYYLLLLLMVTFNGLCLITMKVSFVIIILRKQLHTKSKQKSMIIR